MGILLYEMRDEGDLVMVGANPAADRTLGINTSVLLGKTIEEAFPGLAATEIPDRYREVASEGTTFKIARFPYDHGGIRGVYEVNAFQTAPGEMAVYFLDITERDEVEQALREGEERLRLATRSARVGIWEYELETDCLEWDDLMYEMHGVDRASAKPGIQRWRDCVHPHDLVWAEEEFKASLPEGGPPFDTEFRIVRTSDGAVRHIRGLAGVIRDEGGNALRALGTNWDITESREAREAILESEEKFRTVVQQSNDAIYILFENRFDLVNDRFCRLTGVTPEEAAGPDFDFRDLVAPWSVPLIEERQAKRDRGEEVPAVYPFDIRTRDGRIVHVEVSVTQIEYRGRKAVLGVLRDLTEQRKLEAQLNQSQKMESIGRLSGGIAHDLNNLLTPIIGFGELMLEDLPSGSGLRRAAREVVDAGFRARDLVRQLLAFSRQQTLDFQPINLNKMIQDFRQLIRRTIPENIEIRISADPALPTIKGDRSQLEQVIMNLVINARDAMSGGGMLRIDTESVELDQTFCRSHPGAKPGRFAKISVMDTGVGMDERVQERLFEPFFTTKETGEGTGLGLATVYGIVKQHEGYIYVDSEPGEGSVFRCYFPEVSEVPATSTKAEEPRRRVQGEERVLVVEDDPRVRDLAVNVLQRHGYEVLEAKDGLEALQVLEELEGPLDLLLTDVVMPAMDGCQLFEAAAADRPDLKVLYMSGYSEEVVSHDGVLDEGVPFLEKPFTVRSLSEKVREVLDRD